MGAVANELDPDPPVGDEEALDPDGYEAVTSICRDGCCLASARALTLLRDPSPALRARPRTFLGRPHVRDGRKLSGTTASRPGRRPLLSGTADTCPGRPRPRPGRAPPYGFPFGDPPESVLPHCHNHLAAFVVSPTLRCTRPSVWADRTNKV